MANLLHRVAFAPDQHVEKGCNGNSDNIDDKGDWNRAEQDHKLIPPRTLNDENHRDRKRPEDGRHPQTSTSLSHIQWLTQARDTDQITSTKSGDAERLKNKRTASRCHALKGAQHSDFESRRPGEHEEQKCKARPGPSK